MTADSAYFRGTGSETITNTTDNTVNVGDTVDNFSFPVQTSTVSTVLRQITYTIAKT
jgi:hypothetical protein